MKCSKRVIVVRQCNNNDDVTFKCINAVLSILIFAGIFASLFACVYLFSPTVEKTCIVDSNKYSADSRFLPSKGFREYIILDKSEFMGDYTIAVSDEFRNLEKYAINKTQYQEFDIGDTVYVQSIVYFKTTSERIAGFCGAIFLIIFVGIMAIVCFNLMRS